MFKNLVLTVKGWLRTQSNNASDLRYIATEQKAQIASKCEDIRQQINELSGRGILLEGKIKETQKNVNELTDAVRHHNAEGNEALKNKAYAQYQREQELLNQYVAEEEDIRTQVKDLNFDLRQLEIDAGEAQNNLGKAANRQVVGRAKESIENLHVDINRGSINEAVEQSDLRGAKAEAMRRERKANDNSDVLEYRKNQNVQSMDDILAAK